MYYYKKKYILLSFDIEEFDIPNEYGCTMSLLEQIALSEQGTNVILDILSNVNIKATFFCTTNFAINSPLTINRIINEGHEIASHGCNHAKYCDGDEYTSKEILEKTFRINVYGYRQPRMQIANLNNVNYVYNASVNPTYIPGRYSNHKKSRTIYKDDKLISIPTSVTPLFRIPLFWLSLHHFPLSIYEFLVKKTLLQDGYFNTYFHPWEFVDLSLPEFKKIPYIIKHGSGQTMIHRLKHLIDTLIECDVEFITYNQMANNYKNTYENNSNTSML